MVGLGGEGLREGARGLGIHLPLGREDARLGEGHEQVRRRLLHPAKRLAVGARGVRRTAEHTVGAAEHHPAAGVVRVLAQARLQPCDHRTDVGGRRPGRRDGRLRGPHQAGLAEPGVEGRPARDRDEGNRRGSGTRPARGRRPWARGELARQRSLHLGAGLRVVGVGEQPRATLGVELGEPPAVGLDAGMLRVDAARAPARERCEHERRRQRREARGQ